MKDIVLELRNISKSFQDGKENRVILNDVSLNVRRGEFVAIVGPSGSGKSTFLTIAGMMLSPDQGSVFIAGEDQSSKKQKEWTKIRKDHIGFIFQNHQLLPYLTAKEQLTEFQKKSERKNVDVNQLMQELDIAHCKNHFPAQMSGGERQRVAIARAFVNHPDVILADEPTASLDGKRVHQVIELLSKEVKKQNKAAIMVTHDERVLDLVDTVYHLENGSLVLKK